MQEEEHIYICENNEYSLKAKICVGQKKKKLGSLQLFLLFKRIYQY